MDNKDDGPSIVPIDEARLRRPSESASDEPRTKKKRSNPPNVIGSMNAVISPPTIARNDVGTTSRSNGMNRLAGLNNVSDCLKQLFGSYLGSDS